MKEIQDYVTSMSLLAKANGIEPIIGTVIAPVENLELDNNYRIKDSLQIFNQWLRTNAAGDKWQVVDFNKVLCDEDGYLKKDLSSDIIDPNEKGYHLMAEALLAVLKVIEK